MKSVIQPGTLYLFESEPNPNGATNSRLYLIKGSFDGKSFQKIELACGTALPQPARYHDSEQFHLNIFHINDLHGHLMRFTSEGEEPIISRLAWQIDSARQACDSNADTAVLVITAGDDCGGAIFDEMLLDKKPVHPGYRIYSKLGVDAAVLGNHDLDLGLTSLANAIQRDAQFPVLAANLIGGPGLTNFCHPAAILEIKGIRVGLIGLVTRAETRLDQSICQIVDPIPVAQNLVALLRSMCDVLIIISHLGTCLEGSYVPMVDAGDVEMAKSLPPASVDLIIGGHSHTALNRDGLDSDNIVNGIPIVQTGANGEFLGQVEFSIRGKLVNLINAQLIPVSSLPIDSDFQETEVKPFITHARELWNQNLGWVEDNPDLSTEIVFRDFAKRESILANFINDALVERLAQRGYKVDFAMIDASALQCGLPFGDNLSYGDCFEVMPYTDTLRIYEFTPAQLIDLITDNALRIDHPNEQDIDRGFLHFSRGIRYTITLGCERLKNIASEITIHQKTLETIPQQIFTCITPCFTRELITPWKMNLTNTYEHTFLELHQFTYKDTDVLLRQEMVTYIREHGGVTEIGGARYDGRLRVISSFDHNPKESV